jgi:hypothetical protein
MNRCATAPAPTLFAVSPRVRLQNARTNFLPILNPANQLEAIPDGFIIGATRGKGVPQFVRRWCRVQVLQNLRRLAADVVVEDNVKTMMGKGGQMEWDEGGRERKEEARKEEAFRARRTSSDRAPVPQGLTLARLHVCPA